MRRLIHVPLLHDEADLGTAGQALVAQTVRLVGAARWAAHRETLTRYWAHVGAFLESLDVRRLKLYQDGLPVGGSLARTVVEEAARRGSRNYQLILELLGHGAEICATEDPALLWQERTRVIGETSTARPGGIPEERATMDRVRRQRLLRERDEFIARTIDATLREDEVGVLFLGAEHESPTHLAPDILVEAVKDPVLVKAYFQALLRPGDTAERSRLASYLASPIGVTVRGGGWAPA